MFSRLKQIVSSLFIILGVVSLSAKEIPISEEVQLTIPLGKFSVIEFPFKVTSKNITSFMVNKKIKISNNKNKNEKQLIQSENVLAANVQKKLRKHKKSSKKRDRYISIVQNVNGFTFFTKREGVLKMVIWGYKHPILLTLKVSKNNGYGFYQFIVPQSESKEVIKTEQGSHEKIINKLMVNLFNQTVPRGYKSDSQDIVYKSNGFTMRLNREIRGRRYLGQEWLLTNNSNDGNNIIHEESFYQKGIFAVSLENNTIKKGESIRVFIVRNLPIKKEKRYAR